MSFPHIDSSFFSCRSHELLTGVAQKQAPIRLGRDRIHFATASEIEKV
jgi:hypothetical protein